MGYGSYIKNNEVHEWADYYVKYNRTSKFIGTNAFESKIKNEIEKANSFYKLLETKALEETRKILMEAKGQIPDKLYMQGLKIIEESQNYANFKEKVLLSHVIEEKSSSKEDLTKEETKNLTNDLTKEEHKDMEDDQINFIDENYVESESATMQQNDLLGVMRFITMPKTFVMRKREKHITEYLHSLIKIKTFKDINITGINKLIKKHKTKTGTDFTDLLKSKYFYKSTVIEKIKKVTKKIYKDIFAKNNPGKARKMFKRIKQKLLSNDALYLISGIIMGANSVLAAYNWPDMTFFAVNNVFIGFVLFGLCMKVFKTVKINYKFIFNFDYDSNLNNGKYLLIISLFNLFFIILYQLITRNGYLGAIYLLCCFGIILLPIKVFYVNSRIYLVSSLLRGLFNPFSTIRFRHFYFVDVLQSFGFTYTKLMESINAKSSIYHSILIGFFPLIRIIQCLKRYTKSKLIFPHIYNSGKYIVAILGISAKCVYNLHKHNNSLNTQSGRIVKWTTFTILMTSNTLSLFWDLFVDFSILRTTFMYPKLFYVYITAFNIAARFIFSMEFVEGVITNKNKMHFAIAFSLVEILRRFLWTLMRVEVEHLNNCNELKMNKAVKLTSGELFYKKDQEVKNKINAGETEESSTTKSISQDMLETTTFDTTAIGE